MMVLVAALVLCPLAWPTYVLVRWRLRAGRPMLLGGLVLFGIALVSILGGAVGGLLPGTLLALEIGLVFVYAGWIWLAESAAMMIAGGVMMLAAFRPRD